MLPFLRAVMFAGMAVSTASALVSDASILKPPAEASVAIAMFQDLQSPECARAFSLVEDVAAAHRVPVVLYDFPLPRHVWSFQAAVWARYFDATSVMLGHEFRKFIYASQDQINSGNLQQWVQKFAEANKITLPPAPDP